MVNRQLGSFQQLQPPGADSVLPLAATAIITSTATVYLLLYIDRGYYSKLTIDMQAQARALYLCSLHFSLFDLELIVSHTNREPSDDPAATYCPSGL